MGNVSFDNNVAQISNMLEEEAIGFLHEVGSELLSQVQRTTKVDTGQTKNAWKLIVNEGNLEAIVGNPTQNAIWEEFGTGEFALDGKGRQGAWFVPVDSYTGRKKPTYNGKVVIVYGKDGKEFYKTNGKKPQRTLTRAFEKVKPKIARRLQQMG